MNVKIDIDGVLRNILLEMCAIYNLDFNTTVLPEDIEEYNVDISFPLIKNIKGYSAVDYFFNKHGKTIFSGSLSFKGCSEAINMLHDLGYRVIIVSYQKTLQNKIDTLNWLENNNIFYNDICFTNDKSIVDGDIMIDDNPEFLGQITCDECRKILIDAPYNKKCTKYERFNSLHDFVKTLA